MKIGIIVVLNHAPPDPAGLRAALLAATEEGDTIVFVAGRSAGGRPRDPGVARMMAAARQNPWQAGRHWLDVSLQIDCRARPGVAANAGIAACPAGVVTLLDATQLPLRAGLERARRIMADSGADVVACGIPDGQEGVTAALRHGSAVLMHRSAARCPDAARVLAPEQLALEAILGAARLATSPEALARRLESPQAPAALAGLPQIGQRFPAGGALDEAGRAALWSNLRQRGLTCLETLAPGDVWQATLSLRALAGTELAETELAGTDLAGTDLAGTGPARQGAGAGREDPGSGLPGLIGHAASLPLWRAAQWLEGWRWQRAAGVTPRAAEQAAIRAWRDLRASPPQDRTPALPARERLSEGDAQCFLIAGSDSHHSFFELRFDARSRPFHLALRPLSGEIAVNAMAGGVWDRETVHPLPAAAFRSTPILVIRKGPDVAVLAEGLAFSTRIAGDFPGVSWPEPRAEGLSFETVAPARAPEIEWRDGAPRIAAIPLSGHGRLVLPGLAPGAAVAILAQIVAQDRDWLAQIAALEPGDTLPPAASPAEDMVRRYWLGETRSDPAVITLPAQPQPAPVDGLDVIVALYNQQDYVVDCVASLLAGAPRDLRILIVDDGATDASVPRLESFGAAQGGALQILSKPNGGCASARNYGRLMSDRTHIAFMDADDLTDPGFYPALFRVARETGADFVSGGFDAYLEGVPPQRLANDGDRILAGDRATRTIAGEAAMPVSPLSLLPGQASIWRSVYSRAFLDRAGLWFPESLRAFDDFQFHMRCMSLAQSAWMVPQRKYLYRQHPGQDIRQGDARHFGNLVMGAQLLRQIEEGAPGLREATLETLLDVLNWSLSQLPPVLSGPFARAAAELCVAVERCLGAELPAADVPLLACGDMPKLLAAERARTGSLAAGRWWLESEPGLAHPGTVALARALATSGQAA